MLPEIPESWRSALAPTLQSARFRELRDFLNRERTDGQNILPPAPFIFRALEFTPPEKVRVVLLGQDPYPTPGHAHGLCFSVQPDVRPLPRSLKNIYRELHADLGCAIPDHGSLESWARQGVLLLNTVLTVRAGAANSHQNQGWEEFTSEVLRTVIAQPRRIVFLLWGNSAREKKSLIPPAPHAIIETAHPSPLSAKRFFGCRCFSRANALLEESGQPPIRWSLPESSPQTVLKF